jgi:uncharacterized membrane protein YgaE (UPF0421/DUF939 family)
VIDFWTSLLKLVLLVLSGFFSAERDKVKARAQVEEARKKFEELSEIILVRFTEELKSEQDAERLDKEMEKAREGGLKYDRHSASPQQ